MGKTSCGPKLGEGLFWGKKQIITTQGKGELQSVFKRELKIGRKSKKEGR